MKKRINKKLTIKQAKIIRNIILASFIALHLILTITGVIVSTYEENIKILFVYLSIISLGVLLPVLKIVLDTILKLIPESTKGKKVVLDFLNKEMFTELSFVPQNNNGIEYEIEMFLTIIQTEGYKFFAKLDENDNIILIVKNPEDNEIYRCEILNYSYFNARFKPKSN